MDCGFGGGGGRDLTVAKTGSGAEGAAATVGSLPLRRSLSLGSAAWAGAAAGTCGPAPCAPEGGGFCLGGGVGTGPPFLDVEGDDFPELEFEEVLNPKEWILRVISFDALSTTPGELTLILSVLLTIVMDPPAYPPPPATAPVTTRRRAVV